MKINTFKIVKFLQSLYSFQDFQNRNSFSNFRTNNKYNFTILILIFILFI